MVSVSVATLYDEYALDEEPSSVTELLLPVFGASDIVGYRRGVSHTGNL